MGAPSPDAVDPELVFMDRELTPQVCPVLVTKTAVRDIIAKNGGIMSSISVRGDEKCDTGLIAPTNYCAL